jgi:uncharacterized protein
VAVFFFDTSAIVKRYAIEIGSAWIMSITDPVSRNTIFVSRITDVEFVSAITRRARDGSLTKADAETAVTIFRQDFAYQYRVIEITRELVDKAVSLAQAYALRAYDAIQLAATLEVNGDRVSSGLSAVTLISADAALNAAAVMEGLAVDDPNSHP